MVKNIPPLGILSSFQHPRDLPFWQVIDNKHFSAQLFPRVRRFVGGIRQTCLDRAIDDELTMCMRQVLMHDLGDDIYVENPNLLLFKTTLPHTDDMLGKTDWIGKQWSPYLVHVVTHGEGQIHAVDKGWQYTIDFKPGTVFYVDPTKTHWSEVPKGVIAGSFYFSTVKPLLQGVLSA